MSYPDHISKAEQRIMNRVLANIQQLHREFPDLTVRVRDEEQVVYDGKPDIDAIRKELGHTGMTRVYVYPEGTAQCRASVLFVHGNEEDVLSDSSWSRDNEWLEKRLSEGASE